MSDDDFFDLIENMNERAAIMEYEGGMSRAEAEAQAGGIVIGDAIRNGHCIGNFLGFMDEEIYPESIDSY